MIEIALLPVAMSGIGELGSLVLVLLALLAWGDL